MQVEMKTEKSVKMEEENERVLGAPTGHSAGSVTWAGGGVASTQPALQTRDEEDSKNLALVARAGGGAAST